MDEDQKIPKEEFDKFLSVATESVKPFLFFMLNQIGFTLPEEIVPDAYRLKPEQLANPEDTTLFPEHVNALIKKRFDAKVYIRSAYALAMAGMTDISQIEAITNDFKDNWRLSSEGEKINVDSKHMPFFYAAAAAACDIGSYFENRFEDGEYKPGQVKDYNDAYSRVKEGLEKLFPEGTNAHNIIRHFFKNISEGQQVVSGYIKKLVSKGYSTIDYEPVEMAIPQNEMTWRLGLFDTIGVAFQLGFARWHESNGDLSEIAGQIYNEVITPLGEQYGIFHQAFNDGIEFSRRFGKSNPESRGKDAINLTPSPLVWGIFKNGSKEEKDFLLSFYKREDHPTEKELNLLNVIARKCNGYGMLICEMDNACNSIANLTWDGQYENELHQIYKNNPKVLQYISLFEDHLDELISSTSKGAEISGNKYFSREDKGIQAYVGYNDLLPPDEIMIRFTKGISSAEKKDYFFKEINKVLSDHLHVFVGLSQHLQEGITEVQACSKYLQEILPSLSQCAKKGPVGEEVVKRICNLYYSKVDALIKEGSINATIQEKRQIKAYIKNQVLPDFLRTSEVSRR